MKSIQLNPNSGHSKYSNMGQLEQGVIAVKYYRQAVGVLLGEKQAIEEGRVSSKLETFSNNARRWQCKLKKN